jgi:hypothetical protein
MNTNESLPESVRAGWRTAGRFADVLEREVKTRSHPLITRVVTWFNLCRLCQDLEEQLLLTPKAEDRQMHRALLSLAIASGEGLLLEGVDSHALEPLGITRESIAAKIDSLRITYEQWHTESNPERQAAILNEVFDGPA